MSWKNLFSGAFHKMGKGALAILGFLGILTLVVALALIGQDNTVNSPPDNAPLNLICPDCISPLVCDPGSGQCVNPIHKCPDYPCSPPLVCDSGTGQCVNPPPKTACPGGVDLSTEQPENTVQIINNTSEAPFHVFLEYANFNPAGGHPTLSPPGSPWTILSASPGVVLGAPVSYYPANNPPPGAKAPFMPPNAIGSATWQELIMPGKGDSAVLSIPDFMSGQPWSIRPLKYPGGKPCGGSEGDCGMPVLIESGKEMVGDMSAVDGVNFLLCYEFTTRGGKTSLMDFKTNPCRAAGKNPKGCTNPSVDGVFDPKLVGTDKCLPSGSSHCWLSDPCPAGTCNLVGTSREWCDAIHDGQCANSSSHWTDQQRGTGGPSSCSDYGLFTTYCFSHDDATSSPYFSSPYKIKLVYGDLV